MNKRYKPEQTDQANTDIKDQNPCTMFDIFYFEFESNKRFSKYTGISVHDRYGSTQT